MRYRQPSTKAFKESVHENPGLVMARSQRCLCRNRGGASAAEELQHRSLAHHRAQAGAEPGDQRGRTHPGSNLSAEIIYVEMVDGTYSPIAMMKPSGNGRFPLVLLAYMNGGQGTQWLREWLPSSARIENRYLSRGWM